MPVLDARAALALAVPLFLNRAAVPLRRGPRLHLARHPDSPDEANLDQVRRWVRSSSSPTAIDLFCGAGGLSLGLTDAGFRVLVGADNDSLALETHAANIPSLSYLGDLSDPTEFLGHLEAWGIRRVDIIAGGVPCQPFSRAGRSKIRSLVDAKIRHSEDPRTGLWRSFITVVETLRPSVVVLENVPDLAEWDEGAVLIGFCESLRAIGYETQARIVEAYRHGVPQHRSRLFIVGTQAGFRFEWPAPKTSVAPTVWDAISDLPSVGGGQRIETLPYSTTRSELQMRLRRDVHASDHNIIHDHITREVRPDDLEAFKFLAEGGTYNDLPPSLQRYRTDIFTDKYKRLEKRGLSRTITAHIARDGYWYIHPTQPRTLSIREAARIQTFPDWFRFAGEPSHRYRQVGNAVPPLLAEALGGALHACLVRGRRSKRRARSRFREDLLAWHGNHSRTFPWRVGQSPWNVLLAEMCLHRTRADQVATIYERLIELAPNPSSLIANALDVRALLVSLGLKWRIDNILLVAKQLVDRFDGEVPNTRNELLSLPGIGDYGASAVLVFGFDRTAILMDTNTQRIVSRVGSIGLPTKPWQMRLDLYGLAGQAGADSAFNYALLDLGASTCRSSNPRCNECPVRRHCASGSARGNLA
jgi:DNA (cytosine-5)-methyltransferase 1